MTVYSLENWADRYFDGLIAPTYNYGFGDRFYD